MHRSKVKRSKVNSRGYHSSAGVGMQIDRTA